MKHSRSLLLSLLCLILSLPVSGQDAAAYQQPDQTIIDLVDAPPTPVVSLSPAKNVLILLESPSYPPVAELAREELRLAGLRIDPATNGGSRSSYYTNLRIKDISKKQDREVKGLPESPRMENISWSPDGSRIAFSNTVENGLELWVIDVASATAQKLTEPVLNDALGGAPFEWLSDNQTILYKAVLKDRGPRPEKAEIPSGPVIQSNDGKEAPARTYQDMLKNPHDEEVFAYFATSQLMTLDLRTGQSSPLLEPGILYDLEPSPDGNYFLLTTINKPFSYLVPYYRFPQTVMIYDRQGKEIKTIAKIPLTEEMPKGFDAEREGPRSFTWRADAPATLYWVEARDGGDPKKEADIRDEVLFLKAPFNGESQKALALQYRYRGISWGNDGVAIAYERWWSSRKEVISRWSPGKPSSEKTVLFDRSYEDSYTDPGDFETTTNQYGRRVLLTNDGGNTLYLTGTGASPEGYRPFVDEFDLKMQQTKRLWRSEAPYYESPSSILDAEKGIVLTRRESQEEPQNYFLRDLKKGKLTQLTHFENPYKALKGVTKELVKYQRADGVELSGTLYLPAGYDKDRDGPLPVFMWAYPREYKSADAASQVRSSPYSFIRLSYGSPLFWVARGYAVFDGFSMPIIGEGDEEPNDSFVKQLNMNAEAAVNKLAEMGVGDRNRLAVGGHSYGAFMTANLLAHTNLFAAGIARSGAYNRTLTPFGFQSEERTYWEAPEIYYNMSPFMHADEIKEPILLIHGQADNNSGTFPVQSERFYAALKGHGATTRLVMLPYESHGYRGRESILHMLWEMDQWLEKHVKNKGKEGVQRP